MFLTQGRLITGWLIQTGFEIIDSISELKYLRIFSLIGWLATIFLWQKYSSRWCSIFELPKKISIVSAIILATGLPITVYIGWASCMEMFLGFSLALVASDLLFSEIFKKEIVDISMWKIILIIGLGLCSLFIYQTTFGAFLIPFFLYFLYYSKKIDKTLLIGIGFYFATSIIYYFLFAFTLKKMGIAPSERTQLTTNLLEKISFFFSGPIPLGFSLNLPYNYHGIISQIIYPILIVCVFVSIMKRHKKVLPIIRTTAVFLIFLALMYISVLSVPENFASYRTVLVVNLVCGIAIFEAVYSFISKETHKRIFSYCFCVLLIIIGTNNYNRQFRIPLNYEYNRLRDEIGKKYSSVIDSIFFIRASETIFQKTHDIGNYKDELGVPSTYKDWTPEPLVRQIIYEITGDRKIAAKVKFYQEAGAEMTFEKISSNVIFINMDSLLLKKY